MTTKRLYRSRTNRMLFGVCGGLAEFLDIDPTIIRLIFVIVALWGGIGLLLYIVAVLIVPENPQESGSNADKDTTK